MNAPNMGQTDWTIANRDVLAAEFARLRARLRGEGELDAVAVLREVRGGLEGAAAIDILTERFGLSDFERDILLLTAGIEMNGELAHLCDEARPPETGVGGVHVSGVPVSSASVSFGLGLAVLANPHWSALVPTRPLRYWHLIEADGSEGLSSAQLRIDERILHYLAGINYPDMRLQPLIRKISKPAFLPDSHKAVALQIAQFTKQGAGDMLPVQLWGNDDDGKFDVGAFVASELGLTCYVLHGTALPDTVGALELLARLWLREAILLDALLLIDCREEEPPPGVHRFIQRTGGMIVLAVGQTCKLERDTVSYRVDKPEQGEQLQLWLEILGEREEKYRTSLTGVAAEFRLSRRDIELVSAGLVCRSDTNGLESNAEHDLWRECLSVQGRRMGSLARYLAPQARWQDLVLPEAQKDILRQIAVHLRHRAKVYEEWGFSTQSARGLGISALFAGESGTGKTMAAEVLAGELNLDLYRIDLSAVVSKYIGETEKNLARVFDTAEDSGIILLFDEADALFGKRSEVRDSHDRYANIEISYLLQRMEAYRGLAILTTNQKAALDSAFHRRLRFVVNFPFPGVGEREAIWRKVFPAATPTAGLDYAKLARLQVTGGNIRNIALVAAFNAAEDGSAVTMRHILSGARTEAGKRERPLNEAETRGWL